MFKKNETESYAEYSFETSIAGEEYLNEYGRKRFKLRNLKGYFKFEKDENKIVLDLENTDNFFLDNSRVLIACLIKMLDCKEKNDFPAIVAYASS